MKTRLEIKTIKMEQNHGETVQIACIGGFDSEKDGIWCMPILKAVKAVFDDEKEFFITQNNIEIGVLPSKNVSGAWDFKTKGDFAISISALQLDPCVELIYE